MPTKNTEKVLAIAMYDLKVAHIFGDQELNQDDVIRRGDRFFLKSTGRPASGRLSVHRDDGALQFRFKIFNGEKHGLFEQFYPSGELVHWSYFSRNKQDLYEEWFDKQGRLLRSNCWHEGQLHGRCEQYVLGRLSATREFKHGRKHGLWESYGARKVTLFHGRYVNNECDGWHVWRHANNKRAAEYHYELGVKTGRWRTFYESGAVKRERTYRARTIVGEDKTFYEDGVIRRLEPYRNGEVDGVCFDYHPNGKLKISTPLKKSFRDGFERHYDRALNLRREVEWRNNKAVSDLNFLLGI